MHIRTTELTAFLDRSRAGLLASVERVPAAHREAPPAAERWSTANVIEHLSRVERRIGALLAASFREQRASLSPAVDTPILTDADTRRYLDRARRLVAGEAARPAAGMSLDAAWVELTQARAATLALVAETDGLEVSPVVAPHPLFGPLNFYQWMVFLGGHEGRHAQQIDEIGRALAARP